MSKQKYPQTSVSTTSSTGTPRKGRGSYSQVKTHAKQDRKRHEAYARQDKYEAMTLQEQLNSTDPNGSKRQRARIMAAMEKAKVAPVKVTKPDPAVVGGAALGEALAPKPKRTPKSKVVAAAKEERPSKS